MSKNKQILICGYVEKLNKSEEEIKTLRQDLEQSRTQAEDAERNLVETSEKLRRQCSRNGKTLLMLALTVRVLQMIHRI